MFIRTNHLRHTLSTLGLISLFIYPTVNLAYPSRGDDCNACHSSQVSSEEEQLISITPIEEVEQIANTEQPVNTVPTEEVEQTANTEPTTNTEQTTSLEVCQTDSNRKSCQLIAEFDLDQNGQIELTEVKVAQEVFFESADTDQSADLTAEELQTAQETQRQIRLVERFYELDSDGNNLLSEEELQLSNGVGKFGRISPFLWLDTDGNGALSLEEFQTTQVGKFGGYGCGEAKFSRLDNNDDSVISKDEFVNNVPIFDKFDTDENGIITLEELEEVSNSHKRNSFKRGSKGHHSKGNHFRRH